LTLLALQGHDHPRIRAALPYLCEQLRTADLEHLCWGKLALDLYRDVPGVDDAMRGLDDAIVAGAQQRADTPWLRTNCVRQALVVLALGAAKRNFFRMPAEPATQTAIAP